VEVKFDFPDADKFSRDHFLSLRIGEVQRIARLSNSRSFKFPASAVGTRKYGKVEVYRRVGSQAISVDPEVASGDNQVDVRLADGAEVNLTARVLTTDAKGLHKEKQAEQAASPKGAVESPSHKAVADYLNKHHLEVRLADAMQKVLRERPEDPARMLAEMLLSNGDKVAKLPTAPSQQTSALAAKAAPVVSFPVTTTVEAPKMLPSMGSFHGAAGRYGGMLQVRHAQVLEQVAPTPAQQQPADARSGFLASMGSFHGAAGRFGGLAVVTPVKAVENPVASPAVEAPGKQGSLLPSMGACQSPVGLHGGTISISIETPREQSTRSNMKLPSVGSWLAFRPFVQPDEAN